MSCVESRGLNVGLKHTERLIKICRRSQAGSYFAGHDDDKRSGFLLPASALLALCGVLVLHYGCPTSHHRHPQCVWVPGDALVCPRCVILSRTLPSICSFCSYMYSGATAVRATTYGTGIMFNVRRFTSHESPLSSLLRPPLALVSVGPNVARSATGMNRRSWATPRSGVMPLAASPPDGLGETKRVGFVSSGTRENEVRPAGSPELMLLWTRYRVSR